MQDNEVSH